MQTFLLLLALLQLAAAFARARTLPQTDLIEVRLITPLSTYQTKTGDPVEAAVASPLCGPGGRLFPEGTIAAGVVAHVHKVGLGFVRETAMLELAFREFRLPDGSAYPVTARVVAVDNARERVDTRGRIRGIRATGTISNRLGSRLALASFGHPYMFVPMFMAASGIVRFTDPEIEYGCGTELYLDVQFPASLGTVAACAVPAAASQAELQPLVDGLPAWSYSKQQRQPVDPVTLVFVATREEIARAFTAAGWDESRGNSLAAGFRAFRAVAEAGPYLNGPMRTLMLDGAAPALEFQKSLNTFAKRHHLRIWERTEQWDGRPVWASAATQDVGTEFSMWPLGVTHQIENNVDLEREKVVSDLVNIGCVDSAAYVSRSKTLREAGDYRKGINSDSRVAVVVLNSCSEPRQDFAAEPLAGAERKPGKLVRWVRRFNLAARNHFMRDNLVWRSADCARLGVRAIRHWRSERRDELEAAAREAARGDSVPLPAPPALAAAPAAPPTVAVTVPRLALVPSPPDSRADPIH